MLDMPKTIQQTFLDQINERNILNLTVGDVVISPPELLETADAVNTRVYLSVPSNGARTYPILYSRWAMEDVYGPHRRDYLVPDLAAVTVADVLALVNARLGTAWEPSAFVDGVWPVNETPTAVPLRAHASNLLMLGEIELMLHTPPATQPAT